MRIEQACKILSHYFPVGEIKEEELGLLRYRLTKRSFVLTDTMNEEGWHPLGGMFVRIHRDEWRHDGSFDEFTAIIQQRGKRAKARKIPRRRKSPRSVTR